VSRRVSDDSSHTTCLSSKHGKSFDPPFVGLFTNLDLAIDGFSESLSKELPLEWNIRASPTHRIPLTDHSPITRSASSKQADSTLTPSQPAKSSLSTPPTPIP
jgi:hypothetical protein